MIKNSNHLWGITGNSNSSGIVSALGSVDWLALPYLDSPTHFTAWTDPEKGGRFQICPLGEFHSRQIHVPGTLILQTIFETATGKATLTDWMPFNGTSQGTSRLYRKIEVTQGEVDFALVCMPRFQSGRDPAQGEKHDYGILFRAAHGDDRGTLLSPIRLELETADSSAVGKFALKQGEALEFVWTWGREKLSAVRHGVEKSLTLTTERWRQLAHKCPSQGGCPFAGPWHDSAAHSQMVLRLLVSQDLGSISQSVSSTALNSRSSRSRNFWGYRFSTIRCASLNYQVLFHLGWKEECHHYFQWLKEIFERDGAETLQATYSLDGGKFMSGERHPEHSHRGGTPHYFQMDIFGHIVLAVQTHMNLNGMISQELWTKISEIADYLCHTWKRPDYGPYSTVQRPEHFVVSKLFCWSALDKANDIAKKLGLKAPARWRAEKEIIHNVICEQGFDVEKNSFVRAFGSSEIDSSALWLLLLGFLPPEDPRIQGTMHAIRSSLSEGPFLRRFQSAYETGQAEAPDYGSTFMFIACLTLLGQIQEASDRLAEVCAYLGPLGLMVDIEPGPYLELYQVAPSTSAHISLLNAALYVAAARGTLKSPVHLLGVQERPPAKAA